MLTAKQAAAAATRAEKKRHADAAKEARRVARKEAADVRKALRTDVPFVLKELGKKIKANAAGRLATWSWSRGPIGYAVREAVVKKLEKRGYKCELGHQSGETNMGDFNAPCTVYYDDVTLTVRW